MNGGSIIRITFVERRRRRSREVRFFLTNRKFDVVLRRSVVKVFRVARFWLGLAAFSASFVAIVLLLSASSQTATLRTLTARQIFLLVLYSTILEPDLHLLLGEIEVLRYLDTAQPRKVHVRREFTLQLQQLRTREGRSYPL